MKKYSKYRFTLFLAVLSLTASCSKIDNYLDKAETGGSTEEEVFSSSVQAERFLAQVYSRLPSEYGFHYSALTDEATANIKNSSEGHIMNLQFTPSSSSAYFRWEQLYSDIRAVNIFLKNVDNIPASDGGPAVDNSQMKGEALFLRAFFYAELFKRYGGVPLISEVVAIQPEMSFPRSSTEETVAFIQQDCDLAIDFLPISYSSTDLGRPTKGAAMALKARTLLYAASLLHNPNNDLEKWKKAADAAKAVMDLNTYSLHNNYKLLFHTRASSEIIFQHNVNNTGYTAEFLPHALGGYRCYWGPIQNMVDDYEMTNGERPILSYQADGSPIVNPSSGYDEQKPYENRDPRFYMSILYNGSKWRDTPINTYIGATDGVSGDPNSRNLTGYLFCKMLDENAFLLPSPRNGSNYWIFMRYAEVLLNYAEAQNEYLDAPDNSIYEAVNEIRNRPGVNMPNIPAGLTKDEMRERIRHERRIELAFESHRFWDIKRWRISTDVLKDVYGMRPTKQEDGTFHYERFLVEPRNIPAHYDLFPIPQNVINKNPALDQNPGY